MSDNIKNVTTIGNAIVDVISKCDDDFLNSHSIVKSAMNLIDESKSQSLYQSLQSPQVISGGSAANTAVGLASFGSKAAFIGKVRNDELGKKFLSNIVEAGVQFTTPPSAEGPRTASSIILVTPDAERSMNTYLGACVELDSDDIDENIVKNSQVTYLEGYLYDPPRAKEAFVKAANIAKKSNNKVSMSLSDSFCVERYRSEFHSFIKNHVDILFANEDEAKSLFETDLAEAKNQFLNLGIEVALTLGNKGSAILRDGSWIDIEPRKVQSVEDTTGAGDLFAAGYLYGRTTGGDARQCGYIGSVAASEIISHIGARPEVSLKTLI